MEPCSRTVTRGEPHAARELQLGHPTARSVRVSEQVSQSMCTFMRARVHTCLCTCSHTHTLLEIKPAFRRSNAICYLMGQLKATVLNHDLPILRYSNVSSFFHISFVFYIFEPVISWNDFFFLAQCARTSFGLRESSLRF